jgi:hypothetical protein
MGLRVIDHLHPVLDRPQKPIGTGKLVRVAGVQVAGRNESGDGIERCGRAHGSIAAAVDHLLNLDEELDFADAAAPALEVEAWANLGTLCKMIPDAGRDLAHFLDHSKIERAAPNERLDRVEELASQLHVAGGGPGADESGALPRQSARFIMRNRSVDRQGDGRDFGRGPQAQVNALNVTVLSSLLEKLDQAPADPHRRFTRVVTRSARQCRGIEQEQQVDVGGIVKLVTAELAHRDNSEPLRLGVQHALGDRGVDRLVDGAIGEIRKQPSHVFERELARKIAKCDSERERLALPPEGCGQIIAC